MLQLISIFSLLLFSSPQDTTELTPNSSLINGSKIQEFSVIWEQSFHDQNGEVSHQRYVDETVELIELDGKTHIRRTQIFKHPDGTQTKQYNLVNATNFTPVSWEDERANGGRSHFDFYGNMIKGVYISGVEEPAVIIQRELETAPFDQRIGGLLIASLPLEKGFTGKFPMASPLRLPRFKEPNIRWYVFEVIGKEKIQTKQFGTVDAWKVETSQTFTYWIIDKKPYVVRVSFPLREGESVFEIVKVEK